MKMDQTDGNLLGVKLLAHGALFIDLFSFLILLDVSYSYICSFVISIALII